MAVMAVFGVVAFVPVALRLYDLMVAQNGYYAKLALDNQTRSTTVTAHRGTIYDRNMNVLAVSQSVQILYLDPQELKQSSANIAEISSFLGELLSLDKNWVAEQARDTKLRYKRIASDLDEETAAKALPGMETMTTEGQDEVE